VLVFHATGAGGRALEALGEARLVSGVLDLGLIDGVFRQNLEETGMSYDAEMEMIRLAAERGLVTCPYVFDPGQAEQMARAGEEQALTVLPDFTRHPAGEIVGWERTGG
jgi:predicted TIM-barrel enzyme